MSEFTGFDRALWTYLALLPIHLADPEIRAALRTYQKKCRELRSLETHEAYPDLGDEILQWLAFRCSVPELPENLQANVGLYQQHVMEMIGQRMKLDREALKEGKGWASLRLLVGDPEHLPELTGQVFTHPPLGLPGEHRVVRLPQDGLHFLASRRRIGVPGLRQDRHIGHHLEVVHPGELTLLGVRAPRREEAGHGLLFLLAHDGRD